MHVTVVAVLAQRSHVLAVHEEWRKARTVTTLTWRDGGRGPILITVAEGDLTHEQIRLLNEEFAGSPSHCCGLRAQQLC